MTLIQDILEGYLDAETVRELAREHGIPASWRKGEQVVALVESGRFDPSEAISLLKVDGLRQVCRDYGLEASGRREDLVARIQDAIEVETPRISLRSKIQARDEEKSRESATAKAPSRAPPVSLPEAFLQLGSPEDTTGPWAVAVLIVTAVVAAIGTASVHWWGWLWGSLPPLLAAVLLGLGLLATHHRWVPRLSRLMRRGHTSKG